MAQSVTRDLNEISDMVKRIFDLLYDRDPAQGSWWIVLNGAMARLVKRYYADMPLMLEEIMQEMKEERRAR